MARQELNPTQFERIINLTRLKTTIQTLLVIANDINTDVNAGLFYTVSLDANATLKDPTNLRDGVEIVWVVKQDAVGGFTLAYGAAFLHPGGAAPVIPVGALSISILRGFVQGGKIHLRSELNYS